MKKVEIYTDGACSGNPGAASIAVIVKEQNKTVKELALGIGTTTNNIAEYMAVVYALQEALIMKAEEVVLHTDSELLFNQINGRYKVKNPNIKVLFDQIRHLGTGFKRLVFKCIPRNQNRDADKLAKKVIEKEQAKVVALEFDFGEESPSSKG